MKIIKDVRVGDKVFDIESNKNLKSGEFASILIPFPIKQRLLHMNGHTLEMRGILERGYAIIKFKLKRIE